jgi:hypothetical protein
MTAPNGQDQFHYTILSIQGISPKEPSLPHGVYFREELGCRGYCCR